VRALVIREEVVRLGTAGWVARLAAVVLVGACAPAAPDGGPASRVVPDGDAYRVEAAGRRFASIVPPDLAGAGPPEVAIEAIDGGWSRVAFRWQLDRSIQQDDLAVELALGLEPDFHWLPHLAPDDGYVAAQHVFRSPAFIVAEGPATLAVVPDLDLVGQRAGNPWYLDYDARVGRAWVGMSLTSIPTHVLYEKAPGMTFEPGELELAFFVTAYADAGADAGADTPPNPWRRVSRFLWDRWARPLHVAGEPNRVPMARYVERTYDWAFESWADAVWQEFELDGTRVGAPQFIVNVTQSPNYPGEWEQREFLSIWNQAWFSSLRSASGVMRWARQVGSADLEAKATLTKALALAAPMRDGIFPSVIRTDNEMVAIEGETYQRPRGWDEAYWTNSNRSPENFGVSTDWYHLLDASWTALLMLRWHEEFGADPDLVAYARTYADKLLTLQEPSGFFPSWLHPETLTPSAVFRDSPETSMSVTFLLELAEVTGEASYRESALRAMNAVLDGPVRNGRWEDFETYWSCNAFGQDTHVGRPFDRNGMFKQNTFSIFWTAEALYESWRVTNDTRYLAWGRRTLDELSMAQQVWQPPFIYVPALGGFGVMNTDGEWNDSRQSLFAELFLRYYDATGDAHLFERGVAALKSSFVMMYAPENPMAKEQWELAHPFFGPEDYGFTMENYGHGGTTSPEGVGIGVFTIYDWGNGAASEAYNRVTDHFGQAYIDRPRGQGFGIDSVAVEPTDSGFALTDLAPDGAPRDVRVVFEDGSETTVRLDGATPVVLEP
jgi:hypothetical protein|tara:strand:- start:12038 stop:14377 length:2340 start_codon:yes stop_codon:yes gene_type:complete